MAKRGKKYIKARELKEKEEYSLEEAVSLVKKLSFVKFDESVDLSLRMGVDPKHSDQMVRGTVTLPHGTGKTKKICVIGSGEKIKDAEDAGADYVGGDEFVAKIQKENWFDFEAVVATPDMMGIVGRLGRVLGPKGLMPNPKSGTVTFDVGRAVNEIKAGKVEYRLDKTNIIHVPIGKVSFGKDKLVENFNTIMEAIIKAKPAAAKGTYMKSVTVTSTMGPGIKINGAKISK